jgi:tetratricopeptide (TPR) repeat protein
VYYFWGWFKGDVYHNMAISYSKQGKWEDAITYYKKVNHFNPYFIMPYYFVGNVFNDRFNMASQYRPEWGDENDAPRTDFDRAMAAYEKVRTIAPNYVQMHHQVGTLYMKMHDYYMGQGKPKEANEYLDKALARLSLYENLDPVYPPNYYRKAQIYIARRDFQSAEREYLNNINGWRCYHDNSKYESGFAAQHGTQEAYTYLGNVEYALNKPKEAFEAYGKVLELNPEAQPAKTKYATLKQRLASEAHKPKAELNIWVEPKKAP